MLDDEEEEEEEEGGGSSAGSAAAAAAAAAAVDNEDRRDKKRWEKEEEADKLCNLMAFVLGLGVGVEGQAVPQLPGCVFVLVMDMLMPRWDPLRKGLKGRE
jgi:predicted acylesterase/phospholipase RssA